MSYVRPAIQAGKRQFSISVKELLRDLESQGFPANHARQVCMALSSGKFLRENNIDIHRIDGPPSKTSTTVVIHYQIAPGKTQSEQEAQRTMENPIHPANETPEEWAHRLTGKISGLLKDELAEYGGGDAFLRWVRGYDDEDAA
ncbi:MAG TPA: hypothetical protein VFU55_08870 [Terracidiphilus sp.]|nr:hypothetical protein [Terracidiphilus sp.]